MKKTPDHSEYSLLRELCGIHAPSGNEVAMKDFLLSYINKNCSKWKSKPKVIYGPGMQDNIILVFGKPRTAIFAHMDSIGFTVRYGKQLVKIGGPALIPGIKLTGKDNEGTQDATLA